MSQVGLTCLVLCTACEVVDSGQPADRDTSPQCSQDIECDDGRFCNGVERCSEGRCQDGEPVVCADNDPCSEERCSDEHGECIYPVLDNDGDGFAHPDCGGRDCDDLDESTYPGADESCDEVDHDCDGFPAPDDDGDGYGDLLCGGDDCDDTNNAINPGAQEICEDGADTDCDGVVGLDGDDDGYGDARCGGDTV